MFSASFSSLSIFQTIYGPLFNSSCKLLMCSCLHLFLVSQSGYIPYTGQSLSSAGPCYWDVYVSDQADILAPKLACRHLPDVGLMMAVSGKTRRPDGCMPTAEHRSARWRADDGMPTKCRSNPGCQLNADQTRVVN